MSARERIAELRASAPVVLPSMLMCDFGRLADEVSALEAAGVKALHLDVMDGHFVPNLSYGLPLVETFRRLTRLPLDVHLMVDNPVPFLRSFSEAGADGLTIHIEAVPEPADALAQIRDLGVAAGLALNPPTPLEKIEPYLDACDLVLVMSVMPGFGGQSFQPVALEKLQALRQRPNAKALLQVDGGVNADTAGECARAGADLLVVGSAIFRTDDYTQSVAQLTQLATMAR
jgi:ribulose-phosphate 3-epimerase